MPDTGVVADSETRGLIDDRLPTPLYHQVYLVLRNKILSGDYGFDDKLPGEQETTEMFGVSRITAKRALNELSNVGFVKRERGRGTRVIYRAPNPPVDANVDGLLENLLAMGLETQVELLAFDYIIPSADVVRALQCADKCEVQRAVRVRSIEGAPFSHLTTYVPERVGRSYSREDLATRPLLSLLERSGVKVGHAEQTITATLADAGVAKSLGVEFGSPILNIRRVVFDQNGVPVEYISGLYRPDRYQYRMNLSRVGGLTTRSWSMADKKSNNQVV